MSALIERADGYQVDLGATVVAGPAVGRFFDLLADYPRDSYAALSNVLASAFTGQVVPADVWGQAKAEARTVLAAPAIAEDVELAMVLRTFLEEDAVQVLPVDDEADDDWHNQFQGWRKA